ncbi:hypothetical protein EVAR_24574_1 [Eumeta japonica]|uniref:Uncharacterized protein n=1 Tax=Eumeta variegata TaxID=151549 RepID=A0A4C1W7S5_EUMVA|nr:hypothetical protein EVAR_24574_1 [Eumeta japonica]
MLFGPSKYLYPLFTQPIPKQDYSIHPRNLLRDDRTSIEGLRADPMEPESKAGPEFKLKGEFKSASLWTVRLVDIKEERTQSMSTRAEPPVIASKE